MRQVLHSTSTCTERLGSTPTLTAALAALRTERLATLTAGPATDHADPAATADLKLRSSVKLTRCGWVEFLRLPKVDGGEDRYGTRHTGCSGNVKILTRSPWVLPEGTPPQCPTNLEVTQWMPGRECLTWPRVDDWPSPLIIRLHAGVRDHLLFAVNDDDGAKAGQTTSKRDSTDRHARIRSFVEVLDMPGLNWTGSKDTGHPVGRQEKGCAFLRSVSFRDAPVMRRGRGRRCWPGRNGSGGSR